MGGCRSLIVAEQSAINSLRYWADWYREARLDKESGRTIARAASSRIRQRCQVTHPAAPLGSLWYLFRRRRNWIVTLPCYTRARFQRLLRNLGYSSTWARGACLNTWVLIANSPACREYLIAKEIPQAKISVVASGVDPRMFHLETVAGISGANTHWTKNSW
jgi:glycosyltransferase involved in cell wall biosynthesis